MAPKQKPAKLGDAREKLVAERQKLVARLASKYESKAVQDLVWIAHCIEIIEEMIKAQRPAAPPEPPPAAALQVRGRRGPHEEGEE